VISFMYCPQSAVRVCMFSEDFLAEETARPWKRFVHLFKTYLRINKAVDVSRRF
jgi:hypothetical protein